MSEAFMTGIVLGCVCLGPFLGGMAMEFLINKQESKERNNE
ncbi:hypothetical protein [Bifidobacterium sp.]|jgi:hypothetical protein|nr:hypothetical protein [Bifidobacterium sp.]